MNNNSYILEPEKYLCYKSMVKYERLSNLINDYYKNSDSNQIELYIDVSSFIDQLIKKADQMQNKINTGDNLFISAWILNMCAHYRRFFRTRYSVETTIFLICRDIGNNGSEFRRLINCVEYDRGMASEAWTTIFNYNMDIINDVILYVPNMEIVRTNYDFNSKALYIMNMRQNDDIPAMIISDDMINLQLCATTPKDVCVLIPSKSGSEDNSALLGQKDAVSYYISKKRISSAALFESDPYFYIPLMGAMSGCKNRGFKSIYSISQTVSAINKLFSDGLISPGNPTSVDRVIMLISSMYPKRAINNKQIVDRFNCLSAAIQSMFFFNNIIGDQMDINQYGRMINLYNPAAVKEIVSKVFVNHEIDLNNL